MIPENFIEQWQNSVKWRTLPQIEQDLVISRALVDLYNEPYIKDALVFRGGTALNKLFLKSPARYSEDINFFTIKCVLSDRKGNRLPSEVCVMHFMSPL
jgi:predicted nucleotidyltransferase component of viral defense system